MVTILCCNGFLQATVLGVPWFGQKSSGMMLGVLLLSLSLVGIVGTCSTARDCYPDLDSPLVECDRGNGRNVCECSNCFDPSPDAQQCVLRDGCWKIEGDRCINRNDQRQHFPLIVALFTTSSLSIVLLFLVTILMKCATHKPEMRDFLNSQRKMDSIAAILFILAMVSTLVFIGSIAGSMALIFTTDFEVPDYFGRCIG